MLLSPLKPEFDALLQQLEHKSQFMSLLTTLAPHWEEVRSTLGAPVQRINHGQVVERVNALNTALESAVNTVKVLGSRRFHRTLLELEQRFDRLADKPGFQELSSRGLSRLLELSNAYDAAIRGYERADVLAFLLQASIVAADLNSIAAVLRPVSEYLTAVPADPSSQVLSVAVDADLSFDEFVSKLRAIGDLYHAAADLIGVAISESTDLRVGKIESGSLWATLIGDTKIIQFITSLIDRGINYIYRTYTKEGRFHNIPRQLETLDQIVNLRAQLLAKGVDVDGLGEALNANAARIAKSLNEIASGSSAVEINGQRIQTSDSQRVLPAGGQRLLTEMQRPDEPPLEE